MDNSGSNNLSGYYMTNVPCPTCGACPTCGRRPSPVLEGPVWHTGSTSSIDCTFVNGDENSILQSL